jgi:hypothetical protein
MRKSPRADLEVKVVSVTGGKALPDSSEWCIPDLRVGCVATVEPGGLFVVYVMRVLAHGLIRR